MITIPNWCRNRAIIKGPEKTLFLLWDAAQKDEPEFLQHMCPEPTHEGYMDQTRGVLPEWYVWRTENWGTKWEVSELTSSRDDQGDGIVELEFDFDSAWSPPIEALRYYREQNPGVEVTLYYFEPGMMFAGVYEDGVGQHFDLPETKDGLKLLGIPEDLDEHMGISHDYDVAEELERLEGDGDMYPREWDDPAHEENQEDDDE